MLDSVLSATTRESSTSQLIVVLRLLMISSFREIVPLTIGPRHRSPQAARASWQHITASAKMSDVRCACRSPCKARRNTLGARGLRRGDGLRQSHCDVCPYWRLVALCWAGAGNERPPRAERAARKVRHRRR